MKKIVWLLIVILNTVSLCLAQNEICFDNLCYREIYSYPKLGFYAFSVDENKNNPNAYSSVPPIVKLARLYSFDSNMQGRFIVAYPTIGEQPNINAFKNASKVNLGSLEKVARSQGGIASGFLSVNLPESGYIDHTIFIIANGNIHPIKKYKEWMRY